jgi:hypothetical protein
MVACLRLSDPYLAIEAESCVIYNNWRNDISLLTVDDVDLEGVKAEIVSVRN